MHYFSPAGDPYLFSCGCGECNWPGPKGELLLKLDEARSLAGIAFVISSGPRCPAHHHAVGGKTGSAHVDCNAVDILCNSGWNRMVIVQACLKAGFDRIGISKHFIHVDVAKDKPRPVMWTY